MIAQRLIGRRRVAIGPRDCMNAAAVDDRVEVVRGAFEFTPGSSRASRPAARCARRRAARTRSVGDWSPAHGVLASSRPAPHRPVPSGCGVGITSQPAGGDSPRPESNMPPIQPSLGSRCSLLRWGPRQHRGMIPDFPTAGQERPTRPLDIDHVATPLPERSGRLAKERTACRRFTGSVLCRRKAGVSGKRFRPPGLLKGAIGLATNDVPGGAAFLAAL